MKNSVVFASLLGLSLFATIQHATAQKLSPQAERYAQFLKKAGLVTTPCPKFISSLKSGLSTSVSVPNAVCIASGNVKTAHAKNLKTLPVVSKMIVSGAFSRGVRFSPVVNQQGDVQTDAFTVANAPAVINYKVTNGTDKTMLEITIGDATTGRTLQTLYRVRGTGEGSVGWNVPGKYFLRMQAQPDSQAMVQPSFSASVDFVAPTPVGRFTSADFVRGKLKINKCPSQMVSVDGNKSYLFSTDLVCTDKSPEAVGLEATPVNHAFNTFMGRELDEYGTGTFTSIPFRVTRPVKVVYSVSDPSGYSGNTRIKLFEYVSGREKELANVVGSIDNTTTFINQPGDYYIGIITNPYNERENGDIDWSFSLVGDP